MGRRKLEIKRIEDKSARQVTFSKRRNGLLKKAKEISVLCDLDIGVVIYSCRGKPYHYSNTNSLTEILERYHSSVTEAANPSAGDCDTQAQSSKYSEFLPCGELLQIVERQEVEEDELSVDDFVHLEEQLENALIQTRKAKTRSLLESISSLHHEEKLLEEEKRLLQTKIGGSSNSKKLGIDLNTVPGHDQTQN